MTVHPWTACRRQTTATTMLVRWTETTSCPFGSGDNVRIPLPSSTRPTRTLSRKRRPAHPNPLQAPPRSIYTLPPCPGARTASLFAAAKPTAEPRRGSAAGKKATKTASKRGSGHSKRSEMASSADSANTPTPPLLGPRTTHTFAIPHTPLRLPGDRTRAFPGRPSLRSGARPQTSMCVSRRLSRQIVDCKRSSRGRTRRMTGCERSSTVGRGGKGTTTKDASRYVQPTSSLTASLGDHCRPWIQDHLPRHRTRFTPRTLRWSAPARTRSLPHPESDSLHFASHRYP